jgi:hypothetical protein
METKRNYEFTERTKTYTTEVREVILHQIIAIEDIPKLLVEINWKIANSFNHIYYFYNTFASN